MIKSNVLKKQIVFIPKVGTFGKMLSFENGIYVVRVDGKYYKETANELFAVQAFNEIYESGDCKMEKHKFKVVERYKIGNTAMTTK